jgi:hypothetical protein
MWVTITGWIRRHWLWILGAIVLIIIGVRLGWGLAVLLGAGATTGGAASTLTERQKQREAEGQRLDRERQDLREEAKQTDQMIDAYYRRKGGPRQ